MSEVKYGSMEYWANKSVATMDDILEQIEDMKRLLGDGVHLGCPYRYQDPDINALCDCEKNEDSRCIMTADNCWECKYLQTESEEDDAN